MKTRKFYPLSTIKRLDGRDPASLNTGEKAALLFAMRRVSGAKIAVVNTSAANPDAIVSTPEEFETTKANANANARIRVKL